jgi:hypothetical protein
MYHYEDTMADCLNVLMSAVPCTEYWGSSQGQV